MTQGHVVTNSKSPLPMQHNIAYPSNQPNVKILFFLDNSQIILTVTACNPQLPWPIKAAQLFALPKFFHNTRLHPPLGSYIRF